MDQRTTYFALTQTDCTPFRRQRLPFFRGRGDSCWSWTIHDSPHCWRYCGVCREVFDICGKACALRGSESRMSYTDDRPGLVLCLSSSSSSISSINHKQMQHWNSFKGTLAVFSHWLQLYCVIVFIHIKYKNGKGVKYKICEICLNDCLLLLLFAVGWLPNTRQNFNPFSIYPGTVSGSTTHSQSVYPVTVTLLQPAINIHSLISLHIVRVVSLRLWLIQNRCPRRCSSPQWP